MRRLQSDLLLIFKETHVKQRSYLDLDRSDDLKLFIRILRIMERSNIVLDVEQQSRLLIKADYLKHLQENPPRHDNERLLKNYFMRCDRKTYDVV